MPIDESFLEGQIADLERQRDEAQREMHRIDGALQMCRFLLARARQQAGLGAEVSGQAEANPDIAG